MNKFLIISSIIISFSSSSDARTNNGRRFVYTPSEPPVSRQYQGMVGGRTVTHDSSEPDCYAGTCTYGSNPYERQIYNQYFNPKLYKK